MPIGLQNGEQLRVAIEQAFKTERPTMTALAIEGINRTALDITKEVLSDCLDPGFDRAPARSVVIATVSDGIASLPLELGYCEIGPVFDLNCLDWRASQPSSAEEPLSAFSSEADKALAHPDWRHECRYGGSDPACKRLRDRTRSINREGLCEGLPGASSSANRRQSRDAPSITVLRLADAILARAWRYKRPDRNRA